MKRNFSYLIYASSLLILAAFAAFKILRGDLGEYGLQVRKVIFSKPAVKEGEKPSIKDAAGRISQGSKNPRIVHELIPGAESLFDGFHVRLPLTHIRINSHGFRDLERPVERPPEVFRIAVLGDSFTFGIGVEIEDTFPKVIERMLAKEASPDRRYEVLNMGVFGFNTADEVEYYLDRGEAFSPNVVVVQFLNNDVVDNGKVLRLFDHFKSEYEKERGPLPPGDSDDMSELWRKADEQARKEDEARPEEAFRKIVEEPLRRLGAKLDERKARVFILLIQGPEDYAIARFEELSNCCGFGLIRADGEFGMKRDQLSLTRLDPHPNPEGHRLIGRKVFKALAAERVVKLK